MAEPVRERVNRILGRVLRRIRPSPEVRRLAEEAREKLRKVVPSHVEVFLGGSVAKDTHVKDKREADIFLLFPPYYTVEEMALLTADYARRVFGRVKTKYANHPYVTVEFNGLEIDVVPGYQWTGKALTPVDRTPLHTTYVLSNLPPEKRDEVRLLKAFLKALGVYGAEIRVEGFSGYLCELMIIWAGGFLPLLEKAADWTPPVELRLVEPEFEGETHLVVPDPVDPKRNVAAVVSRTSLWRFVMAARLFLKSPSEKFFRAPAWNLRPERLLAEMERRGTRFLFLSSRAPSISDDVLWGQIKRLGRKLGEVLKTAGFSVLDYYFWSDRRRVLWMYEVEEERLPAISKVVGPEVWRKEAAERFLQKHQASGVLVEHDRLVSYERRSHRTPEEVIKARLSSLLPSGFKGLRFSFITPETAVKRFPWPISDYLFWDVLYPLRRRLPSPTKSAAGRI